MRRIWGVLLACFLLLPTQAFGQELLEKQLEELELEQVEGELADGTSFASLLDEILTGDFDFSFSNILEEIGELAFGELRLQKALLAELLVVVILSAILRQMSGSFYGKSVGEMGFYVCYMVLVVLITTSFYSICASVVTRVEEVNQTFLGMVPVFLILVAAGGGISKATILGPTIMGGSALLSWGIREIFIPAVLLVIAMEMANHLSERPLLSRFCELVSGCLRWGLKGTAMAFVFLLSLQKIGGDAVHGITMKTARIAVHSVPVVGDVMGGAVDTVAAVVGTLQSGMLVAAAIFLLLLCLPLMIKLAIIMIIFKLTAAAAEFICEERLVSCISAAGNYTAILLGVLFLVEGMFLFSALLLLGGL